MNGVELTENATRIQARAVSLVFIGALAQGLMLPFLCFAALYFHYRRTDSHLLPGKWWTFFLWFAALAMTAIGVYQVVQQLQKMFK